MDIDRPTAPNHAPDFVSDSHPDFVDAKDSLQMSDDFVYHQSECNIQPDLCDLLSGSVKSSPLKNFGLDFVPAPIVPGKAQMEKPRPKYLEKFLSQRKVLHMDPKCEDRCSHTEIAPSSMMTLAMELLVGTDSKASSLFKEAKRKADATSNEKESILPHLWVVPKCHSVQQTDTTAAHLQPSIKTAVSDQNIDDNSTECRENRSWQQRKDPDATKSSHNVPSTQATYESVEAFEGDREYAKRKSDEITPSDVEADLHRLTVADLVGSPDSIFSDTESEYSEICRSSSRAATNRALYIDSQTSTLPANLANNENTPVENIPLETFVKEYTNCEETLPSSPAGTTSPTLTSLSSSLTFVSSESLSSWNPSSISPERGRADDLSPLQNRQFESGTDIEVISKLLPPFKTNESILKVTNHEVLSSSERNIRQPIEEIAAIQTEITFQPKYAVSKSVSRMKPGSACDDQKAIQRDPEDLSISEEGMKEYKSNASLELGYNKLTTPRMPVSAPVAPTRNQSLLVMKNMQKDNIKCDKLGPCDNTYQTLSSVSIDNQATQSSKRTDVNMQHPQRHTSALSQIQSKKPAFLMLNWSDVKQMQETSNEFASSIGERKDPLGSTKSKNMTSSSYQCDYVSDSMATINCIDNMSVQAYTKPSYYCNNTSGNNIMSMQIGSDAISDAFCERADSNKSKQRDMSSENFDSSTDQFSSSTSSDFNLPKSTNMRMYQITTPKNSIAVVDGSRVSLFSPPQVKSHSPAVSSPDKCCPAKNLYMSDFVFENQAIPETNFPSNPNIRDFVEENLIVPITASLKTTEQATYGDDIPFKVGLNKQIPANYNYVPSERDFVTENQSLANGTSRHEQNRAVYSFHFSEICFPSFETGTSKVKSPINAPSYNACAKPFSRSATTYDWSTTENQCCNDFVDTQTTPSQVYFTRENNDGCVQRKSSQTTNVPLPSQLLFGTNSNVRTSPDIKETRGNFISKPCEFLSSDKKENIHPTPKSKVTKDENQAAMEVYSSCVKIKLNPSTTASDERTKSTSDNVRNVNATRKNFSQNNNSTPLKSGIVASDEYENTDNKKVREVVMPENKMNESDVSGEPEADNRPKHSTTDESDFAGVVDGSCKNVKEIRAMFKRGPDYANYAKPKLLARKSAHHEREYEDDELLQDMRIASYPQPAVSNMKKLHENYHQTEVAQKVMSLFKNALVVDFEPIPPTKIATEETQLEKQPQQYEDGMTNGNTESRISVKDKVASFNVGKSPGGSEVNNNNTHRLIEDVNKELEDIKIQPKHKEKLATAEDAVIINTTSPKKTLQDLSLKPTASSYDESLDQFYDVFEALSTNS